MSITQEVTVEEVTPKQDSVFAKIRKAGLWQYKVTLFTYGANGYSYPIGGTSYVYGPISVARRVAKNRLRKHYKKREYEGFEERVELAD